jgi:hypothetical protein
LVVLAVVAATFAVAAPFAQALTWTVSSTADTPVGQLCPGISGCSLRQAVTSAEANPDPDVINVETGTYTLTNGQLTVTQDLTIENAGTDPVTISGNNASRILEVDGGDLLLRLLTVTEGNVTVSGDVAQGGAIYGEPGTTITIESSTISNSSASSDEDAEGGGIWSEGSVTIGMAAGGGAPPSVVSGNSATSTGDGYSACGGGIAIVDGGDLTVEDGTTITGNQANGPAAGLGHGGGVWFESFGNQARFTQTTVAGNTASVGSGASFSSAALGAGIDLEFGTAIFERSTVSGNTATAPDDALAAGGGIAVTDDAILHLDSSTVAANTAEVTAAGSVAAGGGVGVLSVDASVQAQNSTIASNAVSAASCSCVLGSGFFGAGQSYTFVGTILAGNTGEGQQQCDSAAIVSAGYNVFGPLDYCGYSPGPSDRTGVKNPKLKSLANYGGQTETMMLKAGSPALDLIPAGDAPCTSPSSDQRGITRPQGAGCDAGAVEAIPATMDLSDTTLEFPYALPTNFTTDSVTVSNNGELDLAQPTVNIASPFSTTGGCTGPVAAGDDCTLDLKFTAPRGGGSFSGQLKLRSGLLRSSAQLHGVSWAPTAPPQIPGTPSVGYKTSLDTGRWPATVASFTVQWQRCDSAATPSSCNDISGTHIVYRPSILGSTRTVYTPVLADAGHTLRARLTAKSTTGVSSAETVSLVSAVVTRTTPTRIQGPYIERASAPTAGTTLYANHGQWTGAPDSYTYQWRRCDADGSSNCANIAGKTSSRYTPSFADDSGHTLKVRVKAINPAGTSASADSAPSGVVT